MMSPSVHLMGMLSPVVESEGNKLKGRAGASKLLWWWVQQAVCGKFEFVVSTPDHGRAVVRGAPLFFFLVSRRGMVLYLKISALH